MKKLSLLFISTIFASSAFSQIYTPGGVNTSAFGSNVLLDGSSVYSTEAGAGAYVGKGVIIPSVDLVNFEFDLTLADGFTFPTYFDGMVVYNNATGTTLTTGNRCSTATSVKPGFYYFSNPNGNANGNVTSGVWKALGGGGISSISLTTPSSPAGTSVGEIAYNTSTTQPTGPVYWNGTQWVGVSTPTSVALTSSTAPAGAITGQVIYNTDATSGLPVGPAYWNGTTWISTAAGTNAIRTVTAATTLTTADYTLLCNATAGGFTVTLPAAASNTGRVFVIRKTDQTTNVLTFSTSVKYSESETFTTLNYLRTIRIQSDGTNWVYID